MLALNLLVANCQESTDSCDIEGTESVYTFNSSVVTFEEAELACLDLNATLARVSSKEDNDFIIEFLNNISAFNIRGTVFLGITKNSSNSSSKTSDFFFVDGFKDTSFFQTAFEEPWGVTEPNGNDENDEDCVEIVNNNGSLVNKWNDVPCTVERPFLCRTECVVENKNNQENNQSILTLISGVVVALFGIGTLTIFILFSYQKKQITKLSTELNKMIEEHGDMGPNGIFL